ncbi:hypothetical protein KC364_g80 [Hortaea werneckii]|nr:hypothetical protein KC364_g80 [Hortaea werneckii]
MKLKESYLPTQDRDKLLAKSLVDRHLSGCGSECGSGGRCCGDSCKLEPRVQEPTAKRPKRLPLIRNTTCALVTTGLLER